MRLKGSVVNVQYTQSGKQRLDFRTDEIIIDETAEETDIRVMLYMPEGSFVKTGDVIAVKGKAADMNKPFTPGSFDMGRYTASKNYDTAVYAEKVYLLENGKGGFYGRLNAFKERIDSVYKNIFPKQEAEIISAMVLGGGSAVSEEIRELYSLSSISHVLAVSGLHTSVICAALLFVFRKLVSERKGYVATAIAIVGYAFFTGLSPSVVRAVIMLEVIIWGHILKRESDTLNSLCAAAFIMIANNTNIIYDVSFVLSVVSVYGCVACAEILGSEEGLKQKILSIMAVSFVVTSMLLPVMANNFHHVSFAGIFANLIAIPLMMPLLVLGIICGITGLFSLNVSAFVGGAVFVILKIFEYMSKAAALLPFADIHTGNLGLIFAVLYYILIILLLTDKVKGFRKTAIISADIICISALLLGNRFVLRNNFIDFIDVGQGDSAIVRTYDGGVYVFDTGGIYTEGDNTGKNIIIPYLDYYGKDAIDVLFISHPDNDHCGGAVELMENINVRKLVIADYDYGENTLLENMLLSAEENGIEVERINAGYKAKGKGGLEFECIYPLSSKLSPEDDDNNGSLVMKLNCGDKSILFTGDIDENDEKFLLYADADIKCDVLKVSHHGSKYSSTEEFVNKTDADFAVISCGKNNTYGHPDGEAVKRLENSGSEVFITSEHGTISFVTDGKTLKAEE